MPGIPEERLARNEVFFREVNERIAEAADGHGDDGHIYEFLCECADVACLERVELTMAEYEHVRADPRRFVLAPGHSVPSVEMVVEQMGDHEIVEKLGAAGEVAEALDPRAA
jgi:hypothetical protein